MSTGKEIYINIRKKEGDSDEVAVAAWDNLSEDNKEHYRKQVPAQGATLTEPSPIWATALRLHPNDRIEQIRHYILNEPSFKSHLKHNQEWQPIPEHPIWEFAQKDILFEREGVAKNILSYIVDAASSQDRNALIMLQAAPGVGKTALLNYIAKHQLFHHYRHVVITFNSYTSYQLSRRNEQKGMKGIKFELFTRIIFGIFFNFSMEAWNSLMADPVYKKEIYSIFEHHTMKQYMEAYMGTKDIMLHVDELGRLYTERTDRRRFDLDTIITELGCLRDAGVVSLITSLNPALLQRSVTSSGRGINWVEVSLIQDIDAFLAVLPEKMKTDAIKRVMVQCNGHARTLSLFLNWVYKDIDNRITMSEEELIRLFVLSPHFPSQTAPPETLVMECLLPQNRPLDYKVEGKTLSEWIQSGHLINAGLDRDQTIIPTMSKIYLRARMNQNSKWTELHQILTLCNRWDWHEFERMHVAWERMMRRLHSGEQLTFRKLYRMPDNEKSPIFDEPWWAQPKLLADAKMTSSVEEWQIDGADNKLRPIKDDERTNIMYLGKAGTKDVEAATIDKLVSGGTVISGFQCKLSSKSSSTVLTPTTLDNHYPKWAEKMKGHKFVWVLAACRDIQPATVKRAESYPNLILLDRERLRNIYGPTLAAHPDFRKANKSVMAKESIEVIKRTDRTNLMSRMFSTSKVVCQSPYRPMSVGLMRLFLRWK